MERWRGRVALVTGCSGVIGVGFVKELARHGMKVIGCARRVDKIQVLKQQLKSEEHPGEVIPVQCDLRKEEDVLKMFAFIKGRYGGVDVCVNNAGISYSSSLLEGNTEQWKEVVEVNILALCVCTREAIKSMRERNVDDGQIVNVNSISGHRLVLGMNMVYASTKHAVKALTEGLRLELRQNGSHIRVSSISPGMVLTESIPTKNPKPYQFLDVSDVTEALLFILSTKPHVEINDILMRTVVQKL